MGTLTHFVCTDCLREFSVPENAYAKDPHVEACANCGQAMSIQLLEAQKHMDIIALHGCEYHRPSLGQTTEIAVPLVPPSSDQILSWISDEASPFDETSLSDESTFDHQETFVDKLSTRWT